MSRSPLGLLAFASGTVVPIEGVPDPVFSEKMLGEGIAIDPRQGVVTAPCEGELVQVHRAGHAYGILAPGGAKILLHVGLESVKLNGSVFRMKVKEGDRVVAGQPLVEFDPGELASKCSSPLVILVVENSDEHPVHWWAAGSVTAGKDLVMNLGAGDPAELPRVAAEPGLSCTNEVSRIAQVRHKEGLHARPAALIANAARQFNATVEIIHHGKRANARSVVALMGLAVLENAEVGIVASGPEAEDALEAVISVIETDSAAVSAVPSSCLPPASLPRTVVPQHRVADGVLMGVTASRGLVIGQTIHHQPGGICAEIPEEASDPSVESERLNQALASVVADIEAAYEQAQRRGSRDEATIFEAHRTLIGDPELVGQAAQWITSGKSAAYAWSRTLRDQCQVFEQSGSVLIAERTADLRDLETQVLCKLLGTRIVPQKLPANAILLADELTPGGLSVLDRTCLAGIVTQRGGPMSHVAIVARGLGIPFLTAVGAELRSVPNGQMAILDADNGRFCWKPAEGEVAAAQAQLEADRKRRADAQAASFMPAVTKDGVTLEVAANIASASEVATITALGADGVGLLRTELYFVERQTAPTIEEQRAIYQQVLDALGDRPVIIRTLDVGADKALAYVPLPQEDNPALGLRGIRLGFSREDLLRDQLKACLMLRPLSRVKILLPMVTDMAEIRLVRTMLEGAASEMGLTEMPALGAMIETPAAAILSDQLAQVVDFFSLGTNDLTQYTLAIDRCNAALAHRLDDLHPAVLRMIAKTCEGADQHKKWVGVCGGMASDPLAVPLLVGLGVTELSVSPAMIPEIKMLVRRLEVQACRVAAQQALKLLTAGSVREFIRTTWPWIDGKAQ